MSATLPTLVYSKVKYAKVLNSTGLDNHTVYFTETYLLLEASGSREMLKTMLKREQSAGKETEQHDLLYCFGLAAPIVSPYLPMPT